MLIRNYNITKSTVRIFRLCQPDEVSTDYERFRSRCLRVDRRTRLDDLRIQTNYPARQQTATSGGSPPTPPSKPRPLPAGYAARPRDQRPPRRSGEAEAPRRHSWPLGRYIGAARRRKPRQVRAACSCVEARRNSAAPAGRRPSEGRRGRRQESSSCRMKRTRSSVREPSPALRVVTPQLR